MLSSPLRSRPGLGSTARNRLGRRGERLLGGWPRPAPAVPLRVGVERESGEDGAVWLPASVCCAVSLRLSSPHPTPTGAILRPFLLRPRRAGRCRRTPLGPCLFLCGKRYCLGLKSRLPGILQAAFFTPPLSFFQKLL